MTNPNKFDETFDSDDYMPEFGLYGRNLPSSCFEIDEEWNKPKIDSELVNVDAKMLIKQYKSLKDEIEKLNEKMEKMERESLKIAENTLMQLWDNEYDDQWNEC